MPKRVSVFGGMAAKLILKEAALGADGTIPSGCLTDLIGEIWTPAKKGNAKAAEKAYVKYKPWVDLSTPAGATAEIEKETLKYRALSRRRPGPKVRSPTRDDMPLQILADLKLK
jgi:dihydrodipicolinate synthase/N-acetylneuraminate lyase